MSVENWKLEKDLCRCCLSEGTFQNLAEPCTNQGAEEIYSDMLIEGLDVNLTPVSGPLCTSTYTICEECILRLRDACSFKRQVLLSEKRFRELYSKDIIQCHSSVKKEAPDSDNEEGPVKQEMIEDDDDFRQYDDDDDGNLKCEVEEEIQEVKKAKTKKPKAKEKTKPKKRLGRPRKAPGGPEAEPEAEPDGDPAGTNDNKGSAGKFCLGAADYRRDGNHYHCSHCDKRYDKICSLRTHVKTVHYKIPKYNCPYCDAAFMTFAPLTVHKLEAHDVDDRFKCNACKGAFNTRVQLKKHLNTFHMMGERHKCEFCEYESFSFESLYKHKFKHRTVKNYHCRFCRKAFLRKTTMDLHERIHTGDRRKVCAVCGKAFVQKASLNYHMTKYHPEVNF